MRPLVKNTPTDTIESFQLEVEPYIDSLKKYCQGLGKSKWDSDDLFQETLTKAYLSWKKKANKMSKAYLYRIASNTWIDQHRKRKLDEDYSQDLTLFKTDVQTSEQTIEAVEVLLRELTPKQRIVLVLIDGFGYSAKEAADKIGDSEGSVKATLHRARKKLKSYKQENEEAEQLDDERTTRYVTAIQSGNPVPFIHFYQQETKQTRMSHSSPVKMQNQLSMSSVNNSYIIFAIHLTNGETFFIPFYKYELFSLLINTGKMKAYLPIAA